MFAQTAAFKPSGGTPPPEIIENKIYCISHGCSPQPLSLNQVGVRKCNRKYSTVTIIWDGCTHRYKIGQNIRKLLKIDSESRKYHLTGARIQFMNITMKWHLQKWCYGANQKTLCWKTMISQLFVKAVNCYLASTRAQLMKTTIKWRRHKWCSGASQMTESWKLLFFEKS